MLYGRNLCFHLLLLTIFFFFCSLSPIVWFFDDGQGNINLEGLSFVTFSVNKKILCLNIVSFFNFFFPLSDFFLWIYFLLNLLVFNLLSYLFEFMHKGVAWMSFFMWFCPPIWKVGLKSSVIDSIIVEMKRNRAPCEVWRL